MSVLSPAQVRTFLATAKEDRFYALYVLALTTGMRQGEMLALKWHDVDLDGATLQVRGNLQNVGGVYSIVEPKTKSGRRRIALPAVTAEALRAHQARQETERRQASDGRRAKDGRTTIWSFPTLSDAPSTA
jgi:integrase